MNLYDLVGRKDRAIVHIDGVQASIERVNGLLHRVLTFDPQAVLELARANEFSVLAGFPRSLNWQLVTLQDNHAELSIEARLGDTDQWVVIGGAQGGENNKPLTKKLSALSALSPWGSNPTTEVALNWPLDCGRRCGYDLRIRNLSAHPLWLDTGRALNPRERIVPLLKGTGIEVGPGANPIVRPSDQINVRYVESASAQEWQERYRKSKGSADDLGDLWDHYIIDSAQHLSTIADNSLDFVFSNHVFEHLPNPIGVLNTWLKKLRVGGLIAGVVPDARYTFDCRQPLSETSDFCAEDASNDFEVRDAHYERWCAHTAPYNTPAELKSRGYSVHVHYYSPDVFSRLSGLLGTSVSQVFFESTPNNKDFGFLLRKSEAP